MKRRRWSERKIVVNEKDHAFVSVSTTEIAVCYERQTGGFDEVFEPKREVVLFAQSNHAANRVALDLSIEYAVELYNALGEAIKEAKR